MKRVLCCMFAAMMVFSALSPALADSSMLDAELSGRIGAKVSSYRDMADAPKSDVIVFSINGDERVTIRPYAAPVKVKVNIEYSARGYNGFEQEIEISSLFSSASLKSMKSASMAICGR